MRTLLICSTCKRGKPKANWVALPPCFTPKPGVEITTTVCQDCLAEAFIQQSNAIFCELGTIKIGSAFAHFIGGITTLTKHEQLTPVDVLGALRCSFEFAKNLKD